MVRCMESVPHSQMEARKETNTSSRSRIFLRVRLGPVVLFSRTAQSEARHMSLYTTPQPDHEDVLLCNVVHMKVTLPLLRVVLRFMAYWIATTGGHVFCEKFCKLRQLLVIQQ